MSIPDMVQELEALETISIRGNLSIEDIVRHQINRCNQSISAADPSIFEGNVRALMKHLPTTIYAKVLAKQDEYNSETVSYSYKETCGQQIGSINNPFVSVPGRPEWDFLMDIPEPYREKHKDEIEILSPVRVAGLETDYEKLYELILQAFEGIGLTWNVEGKTVEMGRVIKTVIPEWLIADSTDAVVEVLTKARTEFKQLNDITYNLLIEELRLQTPPTPVM